MTTLNHNPHRIHIAGTEDDDVITIVEGDNNDFLIEAKGGNDVIRDFCNGKDVIYAGNGNDTVRILKGEKWVSGGPGDDSVIGGKDRDEIYGDEGNDHLDGGPGDDKVDGGYGDDRIIDISGKDKLYGGKGRDEIVAWGGDKEAHGGDDNDTIRTGEGHDKVHGGNGDDDLAAGTGKNEIHGDGGNDILRSLLGDDFLYGGSDNDTFVWKKDSLRGTDYIKDFDAREDTIKFEGITANQLSLSMQSAEQSASAKAILKISSQTGEVLQTVEIDDVHHQFGDSSGAEILQRLIDQNTIQFA